MAHRAQNASRASANEGLVTDHPRRAVTWTMPRASSRIRASRERAKSVARLCLPRQALARSRPDKMAL